MTPGGGEPGGPDRRAGGCSGRTASTPVTVLGAVVGVIALAVGVVLILVVIGTRSRNGRDVARNDTAATALLFDRDDVEEVDDWSERLGSLGRSSILWIDLLRPDDERARELAHSLDLTQSSCERLTDSKESRPSATSGRISM